MVLKSRYFRFTDSVRWFKEVGSSLSNTWIGSSRCIDPVYQPTTADAGDEIHVHPGGTFLVRENGVAEKGVFVMPKPILEKTYGRIEDDADRMEGLVANGYATEIDKPTRSFDYAAVNTDRGIEFPPVTGLIAPGEHEHSPILQNLVTSTADSGLLYAAHVAGARITHRDVHRQPLSMSASLFIETQDGDRIEIRASPISSDVAVIDQSTRFGSAAEAGDPVRENIVPKRINDAYTAFPANQMHDVTGVIGTYLLHGTINEPEAPRP